jgi:hypothetical protein
VNSQDVTSIPKGGATMELNLTISAASSAEVATCRKKGE